MMSDTSPTQHSARRYMRMYLGLILIVVAFGGGILVGKSLVLKSQSSAPSPIYVTVTADRNVDHSGGVNFNQFWQVWDLVKQKYVKQPVNDSDLFYGAMQGMVAGLNDPYSVFFPPKPATEFKRSLSGEFSGIGAEIGDKNNQLVVIAPLPNSPAEKAGLRPGDRILAIDHKITLGMDVNTAVEFIRGPSGTTTTLTIGRGVTKPADVIITRAAISVPAVMFEMKPGKIAYLRIMQFNDQTVSDLTNAIGRLKANRAAGVIVDLRNNPGGYLDSAVAMASDWLADGAIVSEKFSDGHANVHTASGPHELLGLPTAVLVNGGSASASEIVAGALQDRKVATIIGEKTFGKGSVQDFQQLPDGSAIKVTVAEWYTPDDHNINKTGITPDIMVKEDFTKEKVGQDVMIDKALQILKGK